MLQLQSHIPLTKVLVEKIGNYVDQYVEAMEKVKLKQGLKITMSISGEGNAYMQDVVISFAVNSAYDSAAIVKLGCRIRGFSFIRAILEIAANELHLCGD
uniref:Probable methionine--tRNA ligase n=1 Tax=Tanacetum cinerariifolium TaxID=118510 RepID=A0A699KCT1_TANCI|nr:probable methionine--tRNA ligase [Tanacetum cinerariifolium]